MKARLIAVAVSVSIVLAGIYVAPHADELDIVVSSDETESNTDIVSDEDSTVYVDDEIKKALDAYYEQYGCK